jgi:hypothetical protein
MARIATAECQVCHHRVPKTEAVQKSVRVKSGSSVGVSAPIGKRKNFGSRISSRQNFRNKEIWVCNDCKGTYFLNVIKSKFIRLIIWAAVIYGLALWLELV